MIEIRTNGETIKISNNYPDIEIDEVFEEIRDIINVLLLEWKCIYMEKIGYEENNIEKLEEELYEKMLCEISNIRTKEYRKIREE